MNLAGIWAFDGDFTKVRGKFEYTPGVGVGIESRSSSWAAYWSGWQYLFTQGEVPSSIDVTDGRADARGLGMFARFGIADRDTSFNEWSASAGLGGRGLIPGREEDSFGLGYFHNSLQQPRTLLVNSLDETSRGLEAYYQVAIARSVQLTFDAQWVDSPFSSLDDGVLIGARLDVRF
jgi:porin